MENRHLMSSNASNSVSHSLNQIETDLGSLNVNDSPLLNHTQNTPPTGPFNSRLRGSPAQVSSLNPGAQEFIPRQERIRYDPIQNYQPSNNSQQQPPQQLPNNIPNGIGDNAETMEDYIALSYLKEFLTQMANNPSMYEPSIAEVTSLISSYLDEDECVLELIVNQIVDQSIIDGNLRYNGVRLCIHLIHNLRATRTGQLFKDILFKRCQRECSRSVYNYSLDNTFVHLRGLALFTAELYLQCNEPEVAEHLPNLLQIILSSNINVDENVKSVCQTLKLCGQRLDNYFRSKNKESVKEVAKKLKEVIAKTDLMDYISMMAKNTLDLIENNWGSQSNSSTASSNVNASNGQSYCHDYSGQYEYDFGNGDENDEEVVQGFEYFLNLQHK